MTTDLSKLQKQVLEAPDEGQDALPSDDHFARELRGFGPLGILAILVIIAGGAIGPPLSAVLVLVWARWSWTPWREIGYVRPRNWFASLVVGATFGLALKFLLKVIVMPLLGAPPINQAYHYLAGNRAALPAALFAMLVGAGFGEETVFRGYMFERSANFSGLEPAQKHSSCCSPRRCLHWPITPTKGLPASNRRRSLVSCSGRSSP